jgi:MoxR-like ATPase
VDGTSHALPELFTVFASQNPVEYEGTYPLPEAQLDRFLLKIQVGYPAETAEVAILDRYAAGFDAGRPATYGLSPVLSRAELLELRGLVARVRVEPGVRAYIVALVRQTRQRPALSLGASPRATVALFRACQATALLQGRDFVIPEDVKQLAVPVLRHRVLLTPEADVEGGSTDAEIAGVVAAVPAPR